MDWDKLKSFHAAAESGSVTAAAAALNISQSAISRHISTLEKELCVTLFQRHVRGLILTKAGSIIFRNTSQMNIAANSVKSMLGDHTNAPHRALNVTAPIAFGSIWLTPKLNHFSEQHPNIRLNLLLDDREYDLLKLEAECAIRLWPASKGDLIQRKLTTIATSFYATPSYLERFGTPKTPEDLDHHRLISYSKLDTPMQDLNRAQYIGRDDSAPREAYINISNVFAMVKAVEAGLGIADLPDYMVADIPSLVKLLPEWPGAPFDLYFIYPDSLRGSKRIAKFRDFITASIRAGRHSD